MQKLLVTDQSILLKPESSEINKINHQHAHQFNKQKAETKCQICSSNNHLALDCPQFKDKYDTHNALANPQNKHVESPQQIYSPPYQNRNTNYRNHNYAYTQNYVPSHQYYGRTPRYYQPRHAQGYRPRIYTPLGPRFPYRSNYSNQYNQQRSGNQQHYQQRYGQYYSNCQQPQNVDTDTQNFHQANRNPNPD